MKKIRLLLIGLMLLSLLIACIPLIFPSSAPGADSESFVTQAIVTLSLSSFALVSAILFLLGLQSFRDEFKKTYYYICTGIIIQALALLFYPAAVYLGILGSNFTSYGGDLLYLVGAVPIFLGLRHFAQLIKYPTVFANIFFVLGLSLLLSIVLWVLPHPPVKNAELYFDFTRSLISTEGILSLFCIVLLWKIRKQANLFYSRPLLWFIVALLFNGIGEAFYYSASLLVMPNGDLHPDLASLSGVVFLVSRIFYIVAGYSLIRMTRKEEKLQENAGPIDVVVYLSSLASQPAAIDSLLDTLRFVTANLRGTDAQLTEQQLRSLTELYYKLQEYLINQEPLFKYSQESIRAKLEHKFGKIPFDIPPAAPPIPSPQVTV